MKSAINKKPSLESFIEMENLRVDVLHPGGHEISRELARFCQIGNDSEVLEIASGTGETACLLTEEFHCRITAVDLSDFLLAQACARARKRGLYIRFARANAHNLPFASGIFDAVISECTTCVLDKAKAICEMVRVAKCGAYVGIHDLCWDQDAPEKSKKRLLEIENEAPETAEGWKELFEAAGLSEVLLLDKSKLLPFWIKDFKEKLGVLGQLRIFTRVWKLWGLSGVRTIRESEEIFGSRHMGYALVVGRKLAKG